MFDKLGSNEPDMYIKLQHYRKALCYATAALQIPEGLSTFEENLFYYTYAPHQIIYRACSWLGLKELGKNHFIKALTLSDNADFIKIHSKFFDL